MISFCRKPRVAAIIAVFAVVFTQAKPSENTVSIYRGEHFVQEFPDSLVVTRTMSNSAPPFRKTISDRALVEKLYTDIVGLPPLPRELINCPMDMGTNYRLQFYLTAVIKLEANYRPSGCASVTLSDGTLKSDAGRSFGSELKQALGFSSDRQFLGVP